MACWLAHSISFGTGEPIDGFFPNIILQSLFFILKIVRRGPEFIDFSGNYNFILCKMRYEKKTQEISGIDFCSVATDVALSSLSPK